MHEIMHLNTRRPSGMTRMMGREVEGLQSASVWIGLWHQQLKKNMTPCLLLHLIHSVPNSVSSHSYFIASPVLWIPFLGSQFSLTFMTLVHRTQNHPKQVESQGTSRISAIPSLLPPLTTPRPQRQWKPTSSFPVQHIGCLLFAVVVKHCCRQPRCETVGSEFFGQKCSQGKYCSY